MSHADAVRKNNPVDYEKVRSALWVAVLHAECDGFSVESLRDKTPESRGGGMHVETNNMMRAVEQYITTTLMATHPGLSATRDLALSQQRLTDTLTGIVPTRNYHYAGGKSEEFGKQLAATIAERTKAVLSDHGLSLIGRDGPAPQR